MQISVQGKKIFYIQEGRGEPFLFVHGWGGSHTSLQKLSRFFSKQYTVYLIDLPGFGFSDKPDNTWGVSDYAELVKKFCESLKIKSPVYLGHSFGGSLGIYLSALYPKFISRLILCASAFKRKPVSSKTVSLGKRIYQSVPFIKHTYQWARPLLYRLFFPGSDLLRHPDLESNFKKIVTEDLTPFVPRISVKTLILWGEKDTQTPVEWAYELKRLIPQSELKVYAQKKHDLPLVSPEIVAHDVYQFFSA